MIGVTDLFGTKLVDYVYLDYGRPVERRILVDGRAGWITDADADTPLPGITTLEVDPGRSWGFVSLAQKA